MIRYEVLNKPVAVRSDPYPDSNIIDIIKPHDILYVNNIENGWMQLHNGRYVLQTDNVKLVTDLKSINERIITISNLSSGHNFEVDDSTDDIEEDTSPSAVDDALATAYDVASSDNDAELLALNDKYVGKFWVSNPGRHAYVIGSDSSGTLGLLYDGSGRYVKEDVPQELTRRYNGAVIKGVLERGIILVQLPSGGLIYVDGAQGQVFDAESESYESINFSNNMMALRETEQTVNAMRLLASGKFEMTFLDEIINANKINKDFTRTIMGYPYQFLPLADPRPPSSTIVEQEIENFKTSNLVNVSGILTSGIVDSMQDESELGRRFQEKIASLAPILTMQAGIPKFLKGFSQESKNMILGFLTGLVDDDLKNIIEGVLSNSGKYYTFEPATEEYFSAVNEACRTTAILLGIGNVKIPSTATLDGEVDYTRFQDMDWRKATQKYHINSCYEQAVLFYIHTDAQVHENFTTATRQSKLATTVNSISEQAMELQFILGGLGGAAADSDGIGDMMGDLSQYISGKLGEGAINRTGTVSDSAYDTGLVDAMVRNISTFLAGGKMIFPEIWSDSQFGRSYNVTIKLISPDHDPISIYMNIIVPLIHILGFVLPRSIGENAYVSPFLVRTYYKSIFNIDLGIIQSCEIVKGDAGAWSAEGLPTQVTVQLTIKDLYSVLSQSLGRDTNVILRNPAQLSYLANLCGINIDTVSQANMIALWIAIKLNKFPDWIHNKEGWAIRTIMGAFSNFFTYKR